MYPIREPMASAFSILACHYSGPVIEMSKEFLSVSAIADFMLHMGIVLYTSMEIGSVEEWSLTENIVIDELLDETIHVLEKESR